METWKIWHIADAKFVKDYQAENGKGPDYGQQPPDYNPPFSEHLKLPTGLDINGVVRTEAAQKAKTVYELVNYTASVAGAAGNGIALLPNGVKDIDTLVDDWNVANTGNEVTHDGTGTDVPASGTIQLVEGTDAGPQLIADASALKAYKEVVNSDARKTEIGKQEGIVGVGVHTVLGKKSKTSQLMTAVNHVYEYLKALQTAASVADTDMTQAGQDAKTALDTMQTDMLTPILALQTTRDAAIADTASYYPHTAEGLPPGYVDDYTP